MIPTTIQKVVAGFLGGLVVGSLGMWALMREGNPVLKRPALFAGLGTSETATTSETGSGAEGQGVPLQNAVSVVGQLAGDSVLIMGVELVQDGWIVVYEDRLGQPGNALGARRLDAGSYEDVEVPLLRETIPDSTYYVVLHKDNGDRTFDLERDFPVRDENGNPFVERFKTASGAAGGN